MTPAPTVATTADAPALQGGWHQCHLAWDAASVSPLARSWSSGWGPSFPFPGSIHWSWQELFRQQSGGVLGAVDWLAGGAIGRMSIFALEPRALRHRVAAAATRIDRVVAACGRCRSAVRAVAARLDVYTLMLTIGLAGFQSLGIALGLEACRVVAAPGTMFFLTTTLTMTGGAIFLVWLAGQITARGVGNGIALILAVGILAELPGAVAGMLELGRRGVLSANFMLGICLLAVVLTALIVHTELARRQLEVTFRRQAGARTIEGRSKLRLKLNNAGIVPTILASWLLLLPRPGRQPGLRVPELDHGPPEARKAGVHGPLRRRDRAVRVLLYGVPAQSRRNRRGLEAAWRRDRRRGARGGHRRPHRPGRIPR